MNASHCHARFVAALGLLAGGLLSVGWAESAAEKMTPATAEVAGRGEAVRPLTANDSPWRRTNRGWELKTDWPLPDEHPPVAMLQPQVHPGLLAAFLLLASLGALLAGERDPPAKEAAN